MDEMRRLSFHDKRIKLHVELEDWGLKDSDAAHTRKLRADLRQVASMRPGGRL